MTIMKMPFIILLLIVQSCASKSYTNKQLLPQGIKSATEEIYLVENNLLKLLQKKEMVFTKNGRIKHSKTFDGSGKLVQETEKKLWYIVELYPGKDPYYCKTRWKPKQRERISCYTKKQYKQNESIYHYNKDGSINKIANNFTTFHIQHFYYANNELTKIITRDKNNNLIDEVLVTCMERDEKGACLKEVRVSAISNHTEEIHISPVYN